MVDNLSASIHLRALLTDLFLLAEIAKSGSGRRRSEAPASFCFRSAADEGQDVAVRVLEPGGLDVADGVHVAFALHPRHVVVLESDPSSLESLDRRIEVGADAPGGRSGLVGPGKTRLVDEQRGLSGRERQAVGLLPSAPL